MPQIQRIGHQPPRRPGARLEGATQLGRGEVGDLRGPLPTRLNSAFRPRQSVRVDRIAGFQIRPMRRQQQPGHLNLDRGVLVALHRRQSGILIEAGHIVFEHTFTLEQATDIDPGRELLLPAVINSPGRRAELPTRRGIPAKTSVVLFLDCGSPMSVHQKDGNTGRGQRRRPNVLVLLTIGVCSLARFVDSGDGTLMMATSNGDIVHNW